MNTFKGTRQNASVTSGKRRSYENRRHKREGSDCLIKTQESAKLQNKV